MNDFPIRAARVALILILITQLYILLPKPERG